MVRWKEGAYRFGCYLTSPDYVYESSLLSKLMLRDTYTVNDCRLRPDRKLERSI